MKIDGTPVDGPTAPVTWVGTGTMPSTPSSSCFTRDVLVPVEFIAVAEGDDAQDVEHHRLLLLNAFAQAAALMQGRQSDDPQRSYSGNPPRARRSSPTGLIRARLAR